MSNANQNSSGVIVTPERSALLKGHVNKLKVLVRVQAPDINPNANNERAPFRLGLVIDKSGSMGGKPLEEAKRCANFIIDQLKSDDVVTIVEFDNQVNVLIQATQVGDKKAIRSAIKGIHDGGTTNLHGGWYESAKQLQKVVSEQGINRIILLSDGNLNEGETSISEISAQCRKFAELNITTSTYGLGRDFNEELMVEMAKAGYGNHYYGETASDLFEPFFEEFALISNLWLKDVELNVESHPEIQFKMLNNYLSLQLENSKSWRMPVIAYQSEAWGLLEIIVPADYGVGVEGSLDLLTVSVKGKDLNGDTVLLNQVSLSLPKLNSSAWEVIAPNELVQRRANEVEASNYLDLISDAANHQNWLEIDRLVKEASAKFANNPWVKDILKTIETFADANDIVFLRKQAIYSSAKLKNRLSAKEEMLSMSAESSMPAFLRRKGAQGKSAFDDEIS